MRLAGQESTALAAPAPAPGTPAVLPFDDVPVELPEGSLSEVMAIFDDLIDHRNDLAPDQAPWRPPNLVFGDLDPEAIHVPGGLSLYGVEPLGAVALILASVDLRLVPISVPATGVQSDSAPVETIVGYRVVRADPSYWEGKAGAGHGGGSTIPNASAVADPGGFDPKTTNAIPPAGTSPEPQPPRESPDICGIGLALEAKDGRIHVAKVLPNTPASESKKIAEGDEVARIRTEAGDFELQGVRLEEAVARIRGKAGTKVELEIVPGGDLFGAKPRVLTLERQPLELPGGITSVRIIENPDSTSDRRGIVVYGNSPFLAGQAADDTPVVNLYPIAHILAGRDELRATKSEALLDLVQQAVTMQGNVEENKKLKIFIHEASQSLIVSGTRAQHQIVEQAVEAMRALPEEPLPSRMGSPGGN
ncbi:MAG: PDZ domain-containing protein [Akkermansiaceae bacterium]|nr:PDZ domain-containing protein [Akkermansiaceae bacterium]